MSKDIRLIYEAYTSTRRELLTNIDEAKQLILTECSDVFNYGKKTSNWIYRGVTDRGEFTYTDPRKYHRGPMTGREKQHNWVLSHLPSWSNAPDRSRSIVASTSREHTWGYGSGTYVCLPYNGCTYGVCSSNDLFNSFPMIDKSLGIDTELGETTQYSISRYVQMLSYVIKKQANTDPTTLSFDQWCNELDKIIQSGKFGKINTEYGTQSMVMSDVIGSMQVYLQSGKYVNMKTTLNEVLNFAGNGMKLSNSAEGVFEAIKDSGGDGHEVWWSWPTILVFADSPIFTEFVHSP